MMNRRFFIRNCGTALCGIGALGVVPALSIAAGANGTAHAATDAVSLALQGQNLLQQGDVTRAVSVLRNAVLAAPDDDFIHGLLGRALLAAKDSGGALLHFRRAAALNPDDVYSRMMADMLSQRPTPAAGTATGMGGTVPQTGPLSDLERLAAEEETRMAQVLRADPQSSAQFRIRRVVLDAGHGGFDSGAVGPSGVQEKDVNLALVRDCAAILEQVRPDLKIFLTRTDDYYVPLSARTAVANQYSADLFLSFHCNASTNRNAKGAETYFCSEKASGKEAERVARFENAVLRYDEASGQGRAVNLEDILFRYERRRYWQAGGDAAAVLQRGLIAGVTFADRGVHSADFFVLRKARMPAVLLETGFLSHPQEERQLNDAEIRRSIAQAVARSVAGLAAGGGA